MIQTSLRHAQHAEAAGMQKLCQGYSYESSGQKVPPGHEGSMLNVVEKQQQIQHNKRYAKAHLRFSETTTAVRQRFPLRSPEGR